jgi:hypothetical protein
MLQHLRRIEYCKCIDETVVVQTGQNELIECDASVVIGVHFLGTSCTLHSAFTLGTHLEHVIHMSNHVQSQNGWTGARTQYCVHGAHDALNNLV